MKSENLSRRMILKSGLVACAGVCSLEAIVKGAEEVNKMEVAKKANKEIPIGLQMWTVRTECAKDFPGTIAAVGKMGYAGVEFAGYYERTAKDIRKMLDDNGLKCCGTHIRLDTLTGDNLAKTIEFNKIIGNKFLIVPSLDQKTHTTKAVWIDTAKTFNDIAAKLKPEGMRIGYHNHPWDLTPIDGEKPFDIFLDNTSKDVIMQLDIGHAMHGGIDPVAYLKKYAGRAVTVHIKEYSATNYKALIGEGDVKWKDVLAACESVAGTQWYIIEEESGAYPPLEAAEMSLKNFKKLRT
ncbi:MAG: sugar phosphate isomerase/epimerase [Sedimentisphaerales bacterium]